MGRYVLCVVALALVLFVVLAHCSSINLRGVHPSDAHLYSGTTFSCKDGSKTGMPLTRVNDDYCDCGDGSDEPGTSACPNGRFLCRNIGHVGVSLHSSRVNDGICDCCDGTDEYDGKVTCQDTCYALGEETRVAKRQELEAFKKGLAIRDQYVQEAKVAKEEKRKKLEELQATVAQKQEERDKLKAQVDELEEKATAARELLAKYKPKDGLVIEEEKGPSASQSLEVPDGEIVNDEGGDDDDDSEDDEGEDEDDDDEVLNEQPKEELLERTEDVREILEQAEAVVAEYVACKSEEMDGKGEDEESGLSGLWRKLQSVTGLSSASPSLPLSGEAKISDLKELRNSLNKLEEDIEGWKIEISGIEDYLTLDLGDDAFHGIRDQTFELHTNQYTYKLTPFKDVKQQHTRLGDWRHWLNSEHTAMEYDGGERCWNGPDRKAIVHLSCGEVNKVISVEEPNKCEYHMQFTTPASCSPDQLARIQAELAALENPQEAILPPLNTNDIF